MTETLHVGDRIRFWPSDNHRARWRCWGEVRAIVDDDAVVIRRWVRRKRFHACVVLTFEEFAEMRKLYQVKGAHD